MRTSCSGTGQDGELQQGVAWQSPRFVDNGDQTAVDNLTGLIWGKDANPAVLLMGWQEALDYVKTLNSQNYLGYDDWRLPNAVEMRSMVNYQQADQAAWLNGAGFSNVHDIYMTSTTFAAYPFGWYVSLDDGLASASYKTTFRVWLVRGGR